MKLLGWRNKAPAPLLSDGAINADTLLESDMTSKSAMLRWSLILLLRLSFCSTVDSPTAELQNE